MVERIFSGSDYDIEKVYSISVAYFDPRAKLDYIFRAGMLHFSGSHFAEQIPFSKYDELEPTISPNHIHPEYYLILLDKFDEHIRSRFDEWVCLLKNSTVNS